MGSESERRVELPGCRMFEVRFREVTEGGQQSGSDWNVPASAGIEEGWVIEYTRRQRDGAARWEHEFGVVR